MTHMSNYGNDRLALYTFESVIKFIQCWTNLRLSSAPPLLLGERYFQLYPEEADPVWGVSTTTVIKKRRIIFTITEFFYHFLKFDNISRYFYQLSKGFNDFFSKLTTFSVILENIIKKL